MQKCNRLNSYASFSVMCVLKMFVSLMLKLFNKLNILVENLSWKLDRAPLCAHLCYGMN